VQGFVSESQRKFPTHPPKAGSAAVDCAQPAAAVGPASLLAGLKVVSFTNADPERHAAAGCVHPDLKL
jgi:hypothetical protein